MSDINLTNPKAPGSNNHPNPMFDFLTGFVPRKLKDLFRWTEYLFYNSPHIFIALTKLSDYVITDITFETDSKELRKKYNKAKDDLRVESNLRAVSRDRKIYGNSFVSLYKPFKRMLPCKKCGSTTDIRKIPDYEYDYKKKTFKYECLACDKSTKTHLDDVDDYKQPNLSRMNIIRWDPKQIDIDYNPVTGESIYYYNIPSSLKEKVKNSDSSAVDSMPKEFLDTIKDDKTLFEFEANQIYHSKIDAPAGIDGAWGFPPLTSTLKQFYYTQVLRKANEAIALDHLVPFRVLHPAQTGQNNDPVTSMSMAQWVDETKKNIKKWRRDPLHIQFAPVALGVTQMGGQGRTLLTLGEIKEAEENIIAGMGVPREFLFGGLSYTGSSVTLRMLENQLTSHKQDLVILLQWIMDEIAAFMSWDKVKVDITNFRFVDDVQQKSMLLQVDEMYDILSERTIAEKFSIDYDEEQEQKEQEQLDNFQSQIETERKLHDIQTSMAEIAQQEAAGMAGMNYDPHVVAEEGEHVAMELLHMPDDVRRQELAALQEEDFVMYAVVRSMLEILRRQTEPQDEVMQ